MILRDHRLALFGMLLAAPLVQGGEPASSVAATASLTIPHTLNLDLDHRARRRARNAPIEQSYFLDMTPGLNPLTWPRNSDMRARLLTPELKGTPLVGWIASNLYRSKKENGWCLEVDPGEGEYVVFYRVHL